MPGLTPAQLIEHELSMGDKLVGQATHRSFADSHRSNITFPQKEGRIITTNGVMEIVTSGSQVTVKKSILKNVEGFWRSIMKKQLKREIDCYKHLPAHPRLVSVVELGEDGDDMFLDLEYMSNGALGAYLHRNEEEITTELRKRWARQTAEGVVLLHTHDIIHADLKPSNLLLDNDLNVCVADFGGSSLLGQSPYITESGPFYLPAAWRNKKGEDAVCCNVTTDIFALGSCIFQIATGKQPYHELEDKEVEEKFKVQEFPPLDGVLFADVIRKCWLSYFESAQTVLDALTRDDA